MNGALMVGLGKGLLSYADTMQKDEDDKKSRSRDLEDAKARADFAATLQERLAERKMQLARQYPTYGHFVQSPVDGSVTGFTDTGEAMQLSPPDPEQRRLYEESKQSLIDERQQKGLLNESTLGVNDARREQALASAELARVRAAAGGFAPSKTSSNKLSANEYRIRRDMEAHRIDPQAFSKAPQFASQEELDAMEARKQAAYEAADQALSQQGIEMRGGGSALNGSEENVLGPFGEDDGEGEEYLVDPMDL